MKNGLAFPPAASFAVPEFYEYILIVSPVDEVFEKLKQEKEAFSAAYNVSVAKKTLPHITIANFLAKEAMENTIIKWMHKIISSQQSFDVMLNNFSAFPPHTIYARIQDHKPFKQLASSLNIIDQYVRDNGFPAVKIPAHPHMTIARKLQKNIYEKAIMDYSRKTLNASFMVDKLILLKRQNELDTCTKVNVFKLTSMN